MSSIDRQCQPAQDSIYLPRSALIESVTDLTPNEKLFRVRMPEGAELDHRPGQFVQVSLLGHTEAPISVASSPTRGGSFDLGVRRVGALTGALHRLKAGDAIGIRGPFGRPFEVEKLAGKDLLFISGGCGLAPMRSLIQYCEDRPEKFGRLCILYGARSREEMLFRDEIAAWEASERFSCAYTLERADDGAGCGGSPGLVTELIAPIEIAPERTVAVIVGPPVMYRPVIEALAKKGLPERAIVVSLERYMRCGVGKCGHCSIDHLYCCTDGPVFWLDDVAAIRGAI